MGKRLVTIATFDQPTQARRAKNVLDEAGILSTVSDESHEAADGDSLTAVGAMKLQVLEQDADKASAVLGRNLGDDGEGPRTELSPEELAAKSQADAAAFQLVWSTLFRHGFWP